MISGVCSYNSVKFAGNHLKYLRNFADSPVRESVKKECIESVSGDNPYERAIVVNTRTNRIVSVSDGSLTEANISVPKDILSTNSYAILHSHPTFTESNGENYSLPVSFGDFELLINNHSLKEIVAINQQGEETILQKKDNYETISQDKFDDIRKDYLTTLYENLCTKEEKEKINELYTYIQAHPDSIAIKQSIIDKILEKQYCKQAGDVIKGFFSNIAETINLKFIEKS